MNKNASGMLPTTIDNHDEALMRYYYVTIAQNQRVPRRKAEVQFRTDWFIIRKLDNDRALVYHTIRDLVRKIK